MSIKGNVSYKIEIDAIETILKRRGLENGGRVQKYIDNEFLKHCEPYTPRKNGDLIKSGTRGTVIGSGLVQWNAPYSRYQYYGKVMNGRAPKQVTNKNLTYHGGGMRGMFWAERAKVDRGKELLRGAAGIAGGQAAWRS